MKLYIDIKIHLNDSCSSDSNLNNEMTLFPIQVNCLATELAYDSDTTSTPSNSDIHKLAYEIGNSAYLNTTSYFNYCNNKISTSIEIFQVKCSTNYQISCALRTKNGYLSYDHDIINSNKVFETKCPKQILITLTQDVIYTNVYSSTSDNSNIIENAVIISIRDPPSNDDLILFIQPQFIFNTTTTFTYTHNQKPSLEYLDLNIDKLFINENNIRFITISAIVSNNDYEIIWTHGNQIQIINDIESANTHTSSNSILIVIASVSIGITLIIIGILYYKIKILKENLKIVEMVVVKI